MRVLRVKYRSAFADVVIGNEAHLDPTAWEYLLEQLHRAAIDVEHGDDLVARLAGRQHRNHLRRHAAGGGKRGLGSFQRSNLFLNSRDRGIPIARVEIFATVTLGVAAQAVNVRQR